jgi:hypothetical protein
MRTNLIIYKIKLQGWIQDFKLGGGALKKLCRAEGGAKIFGVFCVKNHDIMPGVPPTPLNPPLNYIEISDEMDQPCQQLLAATEKVWRVLKNQQIICYNIQILNRLLEKKIVYFN